jgi:hypothetical protein
MRTGTGYRYPIVLYFPLLLCSFLFVATSIELSFHYLFLVKVRNLAFNYILADHEDAEVVAFNRSMLPTYYGLLRYI